MDKSSNSDQKKKAARIELLYNIFILKINFQLDVFSMPAQTTPFF